MNFDEAVDYLLSLGHETLAIKLGLRNTELLLQALDNPDRSFPAVQIAGTNGKGSTAVFLNSICREAKISTGLYTSPHLESITERININGEALSQGDFARYASEVRNASELLVAEGTIEALPTYFEQLTAIALVAFRAAKVELAILETGLGGRLDSTTAAKSKVCGITQIAFDHEEHLGNTIEKIAAEKAAIIRNGTRVCIAQQSPEARAVIVSRCDEVGVTPRFNGGSTVNSVSADGQFTVSFANSARFDHVRLGLRGRHQIENAALAILLAESLNEEGFEISHNAIVSGLEKSTHAGRLELIGLDPFVLVDGAHNVAGARALSNYLGEFATRPLTIVFGAMRDKRIEEIAQILFPLADLLILTTIENPRTASLEVLSRIARGMGLNQTIVTASSSQAIDLALQKTSRKGMICVTGSLYLVGEVRSRYMKAKQLVV